MSRRIPLKLLLLKSVKSELNWNELDNSEVLLCNTKFSLLLTKLRHERQRWKNESYRTIFFSHLPLAELFKGTSKFSGQLQNLTGFWCTTVCLLNTYNKFDHGILHSNFVAITWNLNCEWSRYARADRRKWERFVVSCYGISPCMRNENYSWKYPLNCVIAAIYLFVYFSTLRSDRKFCHS